MKSEGFFATLAHGIRSLFFDGLIVILPLAATFAFLKFTYQVLSHWLAPLRAMEPIWLQQIPGAEFVIMLLVLMAIGLLARLFIFIPIMHYVERVIAKIPLVRIVYSGVKTLVDFLNVPRHPEFKRKVVLVPFPRANVYHLAFLIGSAEENFGQLIPPTTPATRYVKVFMPTTHITVGYFLLVPEAEIIDTNISFEEAIKSIVSCGLINPESLVKKTAATAR